MMEVGGRGAPAFQGLSGSCQAPDLCVHNQLIYIRGWTTSPTESSSPSQPPSSLSQHMGGGLGTRLTDANSHQEMGSRGVRGDQVTRPGPRGLMRLEELSRPLGLRVRTRAGGKPSSLLTRNGKRVFDRLCPKPVPAHPPG